MEDNNIREKVQDLIIEGKLQDAAEELIEFLDSGLMNRKDKALFQLYNQSIHQISQLNELKNAKLSGIIDPDDADRKRNQIRMSLLDINSRISNLKSGEEDVFKPIKNVENTGGEGTKSNKMLYAIIGILAAGIIGLSAMFFMNDDEKIIGEIKTEIPKKNEPTRNITKNPPSKTTDNTSVKQAEEAAKRRAEEIARRKKIEEAKQNAIDEARKKKLADAVGNKTITTIKPEILKPVLIDPKIVKTFLDDYSKTTPDKIKSYSSKMQMAAIDSGKLKKGSIIVYKTGTRRYGKLEVLEIGSNLKIRATTYSTSGSIHKSRPRIVVSENKGVDLDLALVNKSGMDFQWEKFSDGRKRLQPRDQAIFYQIK